MKKTTKKIVETETTETVCDICKRAFNSDFEMDQAGYACAMSNVWMRKTCSFGRNIFANEEPRIFHSYDICHSCFKNKFMPWMAGFGAEPQITEEI
jgi:hypothetical protein